MKKTALFVFLAALSSSASAQKNYTIQSPDKALSVKFQLSKDGNASYSVSRQNSVVLESSRLGLKRDDEDFSRQLTFVSASPVSVVKDSYELQTAKRRFNTYNANKQVFHLKSANGKLLDVIFQVSNDGLAFRYFFPGTSKDVKKVNEEITSFNFQATAKGWLQPMSDAKTGWANVHPSYEEYYEKGIAVGTPSPIKAGWVYPALFQTGNNWVLITETFPEREYCATRLRAESPGGEYTIGFPQAPEVFPGGALNPESKLPFYSPWRIIAVGSLKTIVESTLGTDLAKPAIKLDASFIKPGKASWSWVLLKDDSTVYHIQKKFIDFAADMKWEYCLVDAEWDTRIGYDKLKELSQYAQSKNVGLLIWYNSAGPWNKTYQTPKDKMLSHESRVKEFSLIHDMGIKGVKVDFFGGDGLSMMAYYQDILQDAAEYKLLVNMHGSTLPRGLHRTYPNLVSMEAIKGMEFNTFDQKCEDVQPSHCTMIPFARNVYDPMDYTPMVLYKIPNIKRSTSNGFQLALPVLFLSGVQHLAERPEGIAQVPEYVKGFLQELPASWDDVRFLDGFPGKYTVIARKAGKKWIVAGINGEENAKDLSLDLSFLKGFGKGHLITDGNEELSFIESRVSADAKTQITMKPHGGFVLVFEDK